MKSKKSLENSQSIKIFNGKKEAEKILSDLKKKILKNKTALVLSVISIGEDPASELFIRNKKRAAKKIGIKIRHFKFKKSISENEILQKIKRLNGNSSVYGIIVQLPLPKKFNQDKIIKAIDVKKDVDGFLKNSKFQPVLPSAIFLALKKCLEPGSKRFILALVNSDIFGKTLKDFLKKQGIKISYTKNRKSSKIKSANILITILGKPGLIKKEMIKDGVALIDAGITLKNKNKVVGDIDEKSVKEKACFLTPVPGGIGPITVALLLKNVYYAAKYK